MLEVELFLSCGHLSVMRVEIAAYVPRKEDLVVCSRCGQKAEVERAGSPYWIPSEGKKRNEDQEGLFE